MALEIRGLAVSYASTKGAANPPAITGIDIKVEEGEFISIIGPSGCGKSTLLHCMGGMLTPSAGEVAVAGQRITGPDPSRAAFVFQDYSLFPWRTALDNAATGLRFAGQSKADRRAAAMKQLELVGLAGRAAAYPAELSGGMQQRVAVARALAMNPDILLLDEPFGALDEQSRRRIGLEMSRVLTDTGKTVIMVTHSLDEAIFWADRILVMCAGPGRIVEDLRVDEARPRKLEFMTSGDFDALRNHIFRQLEGQSDAELRKAVR
jgi:NitT/TauT family transport system ATP-binding protein